MNSTTDSANSTSRDLPLVSVAFITYDRLVTLRPTLASFLANTDYPRERLELIVCDDCSPKAVQAELHRMPFDVHCLATRRRGLGANANQGLRSATGDLILQLQDDWQCVGPPDYLRRAVSALRVASDVGMLILNEHPEALPVRRRQTFEYGEMRVYDNRPEVIVNMVGEHAYTDWPHLKWKSFHDRLGLYKEGVPMWETELEFSCRVNAQATTYIADIKRMNIFSHVGADYSYNSASRKVRLAKRISSVPGGAVAIETYFWLKRRIKRAVSK